MTARARRARNAIILVVLALGVAAVAFARSPVGRALLRSRDQFVACESAPSVLYEAGMEREARMVCESLPRALAAVEEQHYLPVRDPFRVYVCGTQESFNAYMAAPPGATARGVKLLNDIFLSPDSFSSWRGDTHEGVLTHELSHLHIYQRLGHRRTLWELPVWFSEGLAVAVSGAGGEGVTADEARVAIAAGETFVPDERGSLLRPKRASEYGMGTYMFYRQSQLFVEYMRDRDPEAFRDFMLALQGGEWSSFGELFEASFGLSVGGMWSEFVGSVRRSVRDNEPVLSMHHQQGDKHA
jgi:hypothetical protein